MRVRAGGQALLARREEAARGLVASLLALRLEGAAPVHVTHRVSRVMSYLAYHV